MFVEAHLIFFRQALAQQRAVLGQRVENASLAVYPTQIPGAEEAIEEAMRNLLRRQRPVRTRPAHILLDSAAERLLGDADLQRSESRITANLRCQDLVERCGAGPRRTQPRARHQRAEG